MEGIELVAFQIIASVGSARSSYIEAIQAAKQGQIDRAKELIADGEKQFIQGHHAHASLIQKEASNESVTLNLILMHAEDQLMSAEGFKTIAEEFIDVYERFEKLEQKVL
ncbi:PTS system cellobiose-specific IIA component [Streptococcus rupicaprae]|uniref:PTS lactose/cellobiose transporter subunit IIA n=2 Tax=Streptococcus TaxID=1301 RepID=A0A7X6S0I3_9STRE|nr:PTS lactose/cellobiose transporter subunit IIA [Streptococcus ovuberis]NKZ19802.1 PTS lactose/cellobiose transporter subunit IIA [Streptococcus ovuberis]